MSYWWRRGVTQQDVADLWAQVAARRTAKDDHQGAVNALRAEQINRSPAPFDARQPVREVRSP